MKWDIADAPEVGFAEILVDLLQERFWTACLSKQTNHRRGLLRGILEAMPKPAMMHLQ